MPYDFNPFTGNFDKTTNFDEDDIYLRLDASNSPVTGSLTIEGVLTIGTGSTLVIEDDVGFYMSDSSNNYIIPNNTGPIRYMSGITDDVNNTGHIFDTTDSLTATSTKIALFQTGGSTKALINSNGDIQFRRWTPAQGADVRPKMAESGQNVNVWNLQPDNVMTRSGSRLMRVRHNGSNVWYVDTNAKTYSDGGFLIKGGSYVFALYTSQTSGMFFNGTTNEVSFRITGTEKHIFDLDNGNATFKGNLVIGEGAAATDYTLTFDGETNDGVLTWMEDENYLDLDSDFRCRQLFADGDNAGIASTNSLTGTSDLTANDTGSGTIKFKGTTDRDSSGFIKIYIGTTAYYIPVFDAITG